MAVMQEGDSSVLAKALTVRDLRCHHRTGAYRPYRAGQDEDENEAIVGAEKAEMDDEDDDDEAEISRPTRRSASSRKQRHRGEVPQLQPFDCRLAYVESPMLQKS